MSVEYEIYRKEIVDFLQTVTIKFTLFADIMAKRVEVETGTQIFTDAQNPYYQNMCGLYSILDTPIYVTSIDNGQEVLFDLNLKTNHPKTAALYKIPSIEYDILCQKYPNQIGLIKSVIYPVKDIQTAIDAENLSLLAYDSSLLHSNERESLISALRQTLDYIYNRWYIADYFYEEMYPIAFMGIVWAILPQCLLAQRVLNLRTSFVHPMHIWEYLISRGLKDYRDVLNDRQALFLYRNIEYLLQNKGKKSNLEILAQNLLQELQVSLVGKTILQQTTDKVDDCIHIPEFLSEDVIKFGSSEQYEETVAESMSQILYRVNAEGYFPDISAETVQAMELKFGETECNILPTRLLELKKAILNTPYERMLIKFLFDSFVYHLSKGHLTYRIRFTDPNLNLPLDLSVQDALAIFQYAHYKEVGIELIPTPISHFTTSVYKDTKPLLNTLPQNIHFEGTTYKMTSIVDVSKTTNDIYFDDGPYNSTEEFLNIMSVQFATLVSHTESLRHSGNLLYHRALNKLYKSYLVQDKIEFSLIESSDYNTWIESNDQIKALITGYNDLPNSHLFYRTLCDMIIDKIIPTDNELFAKYTSFNQDYTKLYNGLKRLFIQLCSYRLTFLETDRSQVTFIVSPQKCVATVDAEDDLRCHLPATELGIISKPEEINYTDLTSFDAVDILEAITNINDITPITVGVPMEMTVLDSGIIFSDNLLDIKQMSDLTDMIATPIVTGSRNFNFLEPF